MLLIPQVNFRAATEFKITGHIFSSNFGYLLMGYAPANQHHKTQKHLSCQSEYNNLLYMPKSWFLTVIPSGYKSLL